MPQLKQVHELVAAAAREIPHKQRKQLMTGFTIFCENGSQEEQAKPIKKVLVLGELKRWSYVDKRQTLFSIFLYLSAFQIY